jgi:aldose 1-epimerase
LDQQYAASLYCPENRLCMNVITNQPAVHIYVGGQCHETMIGKEESLYHKLSGICFETQNFPDAPNHENFPNSILKKGEIYHQETIFHFENK